MNSRTLIACAALALPVVPGTASASATPTHDRVAAEINQARAVHGLPKLRALRTLRVSARRVARELARSGRFGHPATLRISRRFRLRGETLALMRRKRARRIVAAWLRSRPHRRLLLKPRYRWIGVAGARGKFRTRTVWIAHFGGP